MTHLCPGRLVARPLLTVGLVLTTALAAAGADRSGTAAVTAKGTDDAPSRLYALPRRATPADAVPTALVRIGGQALALYDIDGDGSFGGVGVDAWRPATDDHRFALPLEEPLVLGGVPTRLTFAADGKSVEHVGGADAWPETLADTDRKTRAEVLNALATWNDLRMRNGLVPVHLDAGLTSACLHHARYMQRWGVTHTQDPEHAEYSPEGDRVARSGSVGSLPASEEIVEVYSTFYHRISLFHPDTRGAGIGTAGSRSVFNGTEGRERRRWTWPVAIPAAETKDVPRTYHDEKPVPHAGLWRDGTIGEAGFPITLTFERAAVTDVAAELRAGGHDGRPVAFALSSPEHPASADAPTNYKSICLLPHAPLRARTTYWVHVEWTYRGELDQRTWTFRTGR